VIRDCQGSRFLLVVLHKLFWFFVITHLPDLRQREGKLALPKDEAYETPIATRILQADAGIYQQLHSSFVVLTLNVSVVCLLFLQ